MDAFLAISGCIDNYNSSGRLVSAFGVMRKLSSGLDEANATLNCGDKAKKFRFTDHFHSELQLQMALPLDYVSHS